jgi:hypothetical protein
MAARRRRSSSLTRADSLKKSPVKKSPFTSSRTFEVPWELGDRSLVDRSTAAHRWWMCCIGLFMPTPDPSRRWSGSECTHCIESCSCISSSGTHRAHVLNRAAAPPNSRWGLRRMQLWCYSRDPKPLATPRLRLPCSTSCKAQSIGGSPRQDVVLQGLDHRFAVLHPLITFNQARLSFLKLDLPSQSAPQEALRQELSRSERFFACWDYRLKCPLRRAMRKNLDRLHTEGRWWNPPAIDI